MQNAKVYIEMAAELQPWVRKRFREETFGFSVLARESKGPGRWGHSIHCPSPALCLGDFCAPQNCIPTHMSENKRNQNSGTKLMQDNIPWLSVLWLRKLNTIATTKPRPLPSKNITHHQ